jgi:hypothetical protein
MLVLGIDASTTITAFSVIDANNNYDPKKHFVDYWVEDFKGCSTFWEKCDKIVAKLVDIDNDIKNCAPAFDKPKIEAFYIEEPMKRFSPGMSSAETISTLQRFNGIVCYLTRERFGIDVKYVNVSAARKASGVRVVQTKKDPLGRNAKHQTFDHMLVNDLSHIQWPTKKSGKPKDWAYDVTDSYVVARGGSILNK